MSCKILLPVDGSDGSVRAARHVASIAAMVKDLQVHVVNVQAPGDDWMVRRMIKPEELAAMEKEWGESAMAPARAILQATGAKCDERVVQGDVPKTIARLASELGCNQIVMGARGQSALGGLLMGSIATKVLHIADVPVTLVK
ncbi:MAG TPA: universal stress protein [Gammaproteobacteria bacterium]|nr:universal stress protein [Gammaproteobacteria bacterium]